MVYVSRCFWLIYALRLMVGLFKPNQNFKIFDQTVQLVNFYEVLNDVAWVKKPNSVNEANNRFIVLLLLKELVAVLLDYFTDNLTRELGLLGYVLSDREVGLLDKSVNLFVVSHRVYPHKLTFYLSLVDPL